MALDLSIGDVLRMKKPHPCGNSLWEVTRLGADIGMVCRQCGRYVMLARPYLERRVREVIPRESSQSSESTASGPGSDIP